MTDLELVSRVMGILDPAAGSIGAVTRRGRLLLGLPGERKAFAMALGLYQPQRRLARGMVSVLDGLSRVGLQRLLLPTLHLSHQVESLSPPLPPIDPGTCGVLLGSPEHRVRRAIASYQTLNGPEVAKIAFGQGGDGVISGEMTALQSLPSGTPGVPKLLGTHHGDGISMMRMPYIQGKVLDIGDCSDAISLLCSWISSEQPTAIEGFPEWQAIEKALSGNMRDLNALESLKRFQLVPTIRHGDFARWNLIRQPDGNLMVLDWEWGHPRGMPGIDLGHYFAQDARLVRKLSPAAVVAGVLEAMESAACQGYLRRTGWEGEARMALIAGLAYTFGSGQQSNGDILEAALVMRT